jgi:2-dehydro-3-deoxygluconokinase
MAKIIFIGEAMLELSRSDQSWTMGHGGDTLNSAIHMARAGHDVAYLSAIGNDSFSQDLRSNWHKEGIDTSLLLAHPTRQTGLYAITTDDAGERSFTYWRESSAAREMFALPEMAAALVRAEQADLIAFSLITLAILPPVARETLFALCLRVRAKGGKVAFDGNYRPRLWNSHVEACAARDQAIACADIGLPTLDDEALMHSGVALTADGVSDHWCSLGCKETIVKLGADGCLIPEGEIIPPPARLHPVDTSGAGDAFNGGYLAARMNGESIKASAQQGHRVAGWSVMRPGAIPALDENGPYGTGG